MMGEADNSTGEVQLQSETEKAPEAVAEPEAPKEGDDLDNNTDTVQASEEAGEEIATIEKDVVETAPAAEEAGAAPVTDEPVTEEAVELTTEEQPVEPETTTPEVAAPTELQPEVEAEALAETEAEAEPVQKPPPEAGESEVQPAAEDEGIELLGGAEPKTEAGPDAAAGPEVGAEVGAEVGTIEVEQGDDDEKAKAADGADTKDIEKGDGDEEPKQLPEGQRREEYKEDEGDGGEEGEEGEAAAPKPKKEINKNFKDVRETGKWGELSKGEVIGVGIFVGVVIVAAVVALLYLVVIKDKGTDDNGANVNSTATVPGPVSVPINYTAQEKLDAISKVLEQLGDIGKQSYDSLAPKADSYDPTVVKDTPLDKAISWAIYDDEPGVQYTSETLIPRIRWRFGLASLFFNFNVFDGATTSALDSKKLKLDAQDDGVYWKDNSNWLTNSSVCDWYGVTCDAFMEKITEIDLDDNQLVGTIPDELALFTNLEAFSVKNNYIHGSINSKLYHNMTELFILYLGGNQMTGPIPNDLKNGGDLSMLYLQGNNFTGPYPENYCSELTQIGVNCENNICECCDEYACL